MPSIIEDQRPFMVLQGRIPITTQTDHWNVLDNRNNFRVHSRITRILRTPLSTATHVSVRQSASSNGKPPTAPFLRN